MDDSKPTSARVLAEAASFYYDVCELYEDEDLDQDDHLEVVRRAFTSSNCDDFAWVVSQMTGWQTVLMTWQIPDWGAGHHTLVASPEGRLLDARGWTDEKALKKRYGAKTAFFKFEDAVQRNGTYDDVGIDEDLVRIAGVIRALPGAPFEEAWFREASSRPVEGIDVPVVDEAIPPGP